MSFTTRLLSTTSENIRLAARLIKSGELVAFPTETVYGLGANAFDAQAVEKIFRAKGRPGDNPLICHVNSWEMAETFCTITPLFQRLAAAFCPGPLTLVLPKKPGLPDVVTAGLDTVAVRFPIHPVAQELIKESGVPIAAPSANTSGKPSPTRARHVLDDLNGRIPLILDGGAVEIGLESTVVSACGELPVLLRPGKISLQQIKEVAGDCLLPKASDHKRPASPGMKYRHYAPKAQLLLASNEEELYLLFLRHNQNGPLRLLVTDETAAGLIKRGVGEENILAMGKDLESFAAGWFHALRKADEDGIRLILAQSCPMQGIGQALLNRMEKAANAKQDELPQK